MIKVPDYRFKNYADYWEQRKFKEYTKLSQGLQIAIADRFLEDGENRYFYITNEFLNPNSDKKYYIESPSKNVICSKRDILMTRTGNTGKVVTDIEGAFHNNFFKVAYDSKESSKLFLFHLLNSPKIQKELLVRAGNSTIPDLNHNDFYSIKTIIPSLPEQTAIGSFFQDIDQLISLQQRKLEVLKEQKKTYLKLLFPAKGQTKPALRFAGFEDEWEEVKVSDIFRVTRGQVLATTEISEEKTDTHKYPVYSSQTKNEGLLGYYDKYLFETAITWTTDGANAGTVNYREGKFYSTNVNGVLLSDEGFANKVIAEILNNEAWKYVSKVGNPKLMNNVMSEISLVIPNDFREISTLSTFFQDLDKAIAKQEEKVNQLKESKQTLLRKMFI